MGDADVGLALSQAVGDVQRAAGIAHRHHFRAGGADVADLAVERRSMAVAYVAVVFIVLPLIGVLALG